MGFCPSLTAANDRESSCAYDPVIIGVTSLPFENASGAEPITTSPYFCISSAGWYSRSVKRAAPAATKSTVPASSIRAENEVPSGTQE